MRLAGLPSQEPGHATRKGALWLLRAPGFLVIITASALIQSSHAAYYTVASIVWQGAGLGGFTIAGLWSLGVVAEIIVFAVSPRFTLPLPWLVLLGGSAAALRWVITALDPSLPVLAAIQFMHGMTFGLTMLGTMGLLVGYVPGHVMARAQGYLTACTGIVMSSASVASGFAYARYGQDVYYAMAVLAGIGVLVMWFGRRRATGPREISDQPQSVTSGG